MKRKSSGLFKAAMREFQNALLEKESRSSTASHTATLELDQADNRGDAQVDALLEINAGMTEGIGRLQDQSRTLGNEMREAYAELDIEDKTQEKLSGLLLRSLREFDKELTALQDANFRLERNLYEKRLLLSTRKQKLDEAGERELALRDAIGNLKRENARLSREAQDTQDNFARQDIDMQRLKKQHLKLSRQHDELAGKYYQLFQEYNREKRKTR